MSHKVELNKSTCNILNNYSKINESIVFNVEKNTIHTCDERKHIYSKCTIEEDFPSFAIYNLQQFLSIVNFYNNPVLDFIDNYVSIFSKDNKNVKTKFYSADVDIISPTIKDHLDIEAKLGLDKDPNKLTFDINKGMLNDIKRIAGILRSDNILFNSRESNDNNGLDIVVKSYVDINNNSTSNHTIQTKTKQEASSNYSYIIYTDTINSMVESDYIATLYPKVVTMRSVNSSHSNLTYYIAVDKASILIG